MVLESTIVCVDNSEYSRNGDFPPSRFACQVDTVNMLCSSKVQANAESSVGLLTLAGRSARILITSTRDLGRIFTCMHDVNYDGQSDFVAGILKAQLALKHRQNSLQRQRIVVFVTSPITATQAVLVKLGKNLKKNSVAVDIINVGMESDNVAKIDAFIDAVNSNDNSHALHVEAGGMNLAETVMNSHITMDASSSASSAAAAAGAGAGAGAGGVGIPPDLQAMDGEGVDPELEMVLRISMEEERARQAAARQAEQQQNNNSETDNANTNTTPANTNNNDQSSSTPQTTANNENTTKYDDDDADLYGTEDAQPSSAQPQAEEMEVDYGDDEDEMLRRAIELSTRAEEADAAESGKEEKKDDKQ